MEAAWFQKEAYVLYRHTESENMFREKHVRKNKEIR